MHAWNPDVQLLFVLREPVERAFSHYCMHYRAGKVDANVDRGLAHDSPYVREGLYYENLQRFLRLFPAEHVHVTLYDDLRADAPAFLRRVCEIMGIDPDYEPPDLGKRANVRKGRPRFPRIFRARVAASRWLTERSDLADRAFRRLRSSPLLVASKFFTKSDDMPEWPMDARRRVAELYQPDLEQLSEMIGRDLSHWLSPYLDAKDADEEAA